MLRLDGGVGVVLLDEYGEIIAPWDCDEEVKAVENESNTAGGNTRRLRRGNLTQLKNYDAAMRT